MSSRVVNGHRISYRYHLEIGHRPRQKMDYQSKSLPEGARYSGANSSDVSRTLKQRMP